MVMNAEARAVINRQRGRNPEYVFTYSKGRPVDRINTKAWRRAREEAGLPQVRVHDLKHTFGRRLRAKGVSHKTRRFSWATRTARSRHIIPPQKSGN